jgi:hypothetical protein
MNKLIIKVIVKRLMIVLLFSIGIMMVMGFASSTFQTMNPVKQNTCTNITQTCTSCTYNNISVIQSPDGSYLIKGNYGMTKVGNTYNFTFCNTSQLGTYFVDGHGDISGIDTGWGGFKFIVNGSGQEVTQSQIFLILIGIVVMLIVAAFFFILSMLFQHPGTKIFLMALSSITMIVLIGIIASNASVYLAEFPSLANIYSNYYIFIIILAGASMAGLILWLIYYSVTLFNKTRGRIPED